MFVLGPFKFACFFRKFFYWREQIKWGGDDPSTLLRANSGQRMWKKVSMSRGIGGGNVGLNQHGAGCFDRMTPTLSFLFCSCWPKTPKPPRTKTVCTHVDLFEVMFKCQRQIKICATPCFGSVLSPLYLLPAFFWAPKASGRKLETQS